VTNIRCIKAIGQKEMLARDIRLAPVKINLLLMRRWYSESEFALQVVVNFGLSTLFCCLFLSYELVQERQTDRQAGYVICLKGQPRDKLLIIYCHETMFMVCVLTVS